jgi:hypothetical protein
MNKLASKKSARLDAEKIDACSNEDGKANVAKMNIKVQPATPWNEQ